MRLTLQSFTDQVLLFLLFQWWKLDAMRLLHLRQVIIPQCQTSALISSCGIARHQDRGIRTPHNDEHYEVNGKPCYSHSIRYILITPAFGILGCSRVTILRVTIQTSASSVEQLWSCVNSLKRLPCRHTTEYYPRFCALYTPCMSSEPLKFILECRLLLCLSIFRAVLACCRSVSKPATLCLS